MFKNLDWGDVWAVFGLGVAVAVASIALVFGASAIFSAHDVDYYYVSHAGNAGPGICVFAHWTWHTDEPAFCGDAALALDFATKANAMLRAK